jgi:2-amino-4-hydroxy-6-hydroxymethyldihydropteridine diphosphokinase
MQHIPMTRVYLNLGSNIDADHHIATALADLRAAFGALAISPPHHSRAVGFEGPDFINVAVGLDTPLNPTELTAWLHALEERHGRRRTVDKWSSRTLDADIVLFGDRVIDGPGISIPRDLHQAFVLKPLADLVPDLCVPGDGRTIAEMWADHQNQG